MRILVLMTKMRKYPKPWNSISMFFKLFIVAIYITIDCYLNISNIYYIIFTKKKKKNEFKLIKNN